MKLQHNPENDQVVDNIRSFTITIYNSNSEIVKDDKAINVDNTTLTVFSVKNEAESHYFNKNGIRLIKFSN